MDAARPGEDPPTPLGGSAGTAGTVASEATAANVRRVGFLTDYTRLQPMPGGGGMLCWRDSGVNWKQFDRIMFERVQVFLKGGASNSVDPTDLKMLIDYFHAAVVKDIKPYAQVVETPAAGVLRVRFALTELVPTNTIASLAGTAAPYGFVAEIGSAAATGRPAGSTPYLGQTGMEVQSATVRLVESSPNARTPRSAASTRRTSTRARRVRRRRG